MPGGEGEGGGVGERREQPGGEEAVLRVKKKLSVYVRSAPASLPAHTFAPLDARLGSFTVLLTTVQGMIWIRRALKVLQDP